MEVPLEKFEEWMGEAIDNLPQKFINKMHNVAFIAADKPTSEQCKNARLGSNFDLFGLYEGCVQSRRQNFGVVEPDRITLFRLAILRNCQNEEEARKQIEATIKHEIAHHFGFDESGARRVSRKKF
jgi:predicted Zn-dependent protease with MMP-like domain